MRVAVSSPSPLLGELAHTEVSVKPLHVAERNLRFAVVRDITARKRADEELEVARRERSQSEKMTAQGSLVSGVAHENRTPLASIANHVNLIGLRLSRTRAEASAPASLQADLAESVAGQALGLWRSTHPGSSARVVERFEPTRVVRMDVSKVEQVVLNLLENAADAMPAGGTIHLSTDAIPDGARLVVQDEGISIPAEDVGRIFEPLYTTKTQGMGLGLAIVRRIVELHKGKIVCESRAGSGTTFTVTLPAY